MSSHRDPDVILAEALQLAVEAADSLRAMLDAERKRRRAAEAERDRAIHDRDRERQELASYQAAAGLEPRWRTQPQGETDR